MFELGGCFSVVAPDGQSLRPKGRKTSAVLAFLAYNHGREIPRDRLIDLFWSDRGQRQAQGSLRQAIHTIRTSLGDYAYDSIPQRRDRVVLASEYVTVDLWNDDGTINENFEGTFLEDLDFVSPEFDEWLRDTRGAITQRQLSRLERRLAGTDHEQEPELALQLATRILELDRWNESVARIAMSIHARQDRLSQAYAVFEELRDRLRADDLNVSANTQRFFEELRAGARSAPEQSSTPSAPVQLQADQLGIPTILVAPVPRAGTTVEERAVLEEFVDRLVSRMIQMPELHVLIREEGAEGEPKANFQLDASTWVQRQGLGIRLRLVSAVGRSVWSERAPIRSEFEDEDIQIAVDGLLTRMLPAMDEDMFHQIGDAPKTACAHYIVAKRLFATANTPSNIEAMVGHLKKAIELDPEFLPAYTNLIMCYNTGMFMSRPGSDHSELRAKARDMSQRLLMLNSNYANNHISMGWCHLWEEKFASAERSFRRAIALKPYEPHRLNVLATALVYLGYHDEAERFYKMAQDRLSHDMDFQRTDYGELFYLKRDFATALSWLEAPEVQSPYRTLFWRAPTYAQLGELALAKRDIEAMVEDIRHRWAGPKPYRPQDGIQWYAEMKHFRRPEDRDLMFEGFAKAGIELKVRKLA